MTLPADDECMQLAYAWGEPAAVAQLKSTPEDFVVEELLSFEPSGSGEHVWLYLEKRERNTADVARALARHAGVKLTDVGYAGLKDKRAVSRQWFSVHSRDCGDACWQGLVEQGVRVLAVSRHSHKLRRGSHNANRFELHLRGVVTDAAELDERVARIRRFGVPNYFGAQRFGHNCSNLRRAAALLEGEFRERNRHKRGLYLSAARSYVFNQVLSQRVRAGTWHQATVGDLMLLAGRHAFFTATVIDDALSARLDRGEISPSGPLWGRGGPEIGAAERECLAGLRWWTQRLEACGMKHERRALRTCVAGLAVEWCDGTMLRLSFTLPRGAYATAVVRELARTGAPAEVGGD